MTKKQFHLALEGIDGTGKSTALNNVSEIIQDYGLSVDTVRYTDKSGMIGRLITSIYKKEQNNKLLNKLADYRPLQAALYATNGRVNLGRHNNADILLADRSIMSGFASHLGRVPTWWLSMVESTNAPDVIAYLELPLEEASRRINFREAGPAGYEEDNESLRKFCEDYELVIANKPERLKDTVIERVDANRSEEEVAHSIADIALRHLSIDKREA